MGRRHIHTCQVSEGKRVKIGDKVKELKLTSAPLDTWAVTGFKPGGPDGIFVQLERQDTGTGEAVTKWRTLLIV